MDFTGVVEVGPDVLGPRHGGITVDLVEPGHEAADFPWSKVITRQIFREALPWLVITVGWSG
jgi:hypothetical protein